MFQNSQWFCIILYTKHFLSVFLLILLLFSWFTKYKEIFFFIVFALHSMFDAINVEHLNMQTLNETVIQKSVAYVLYSNLISLNGKKNLCESSTFYPFCQTALYLLKTNIQMSQVESVAIDEKEKQLTVQQCENEINSLKNFFPFLFVVPFCSFVSLWQFGWIFYLAPQWWRPSIHSN